MEDLEARKLYQILPDREAAREGYLRVVDESGEDYIYPPDLFVPVRLTAAVVRSRSVQVSGRPWEDSASPVSISGPKLRGLRGPLDLTPGCTDSYLERRKRRGNTDTGAVFPLHARC